MHANHNEVDTNKNVLFAEQVRLLYENSPTSIRITFLNATILVAMLWSVYSPLVLIAWYIALITVLSSRFALLRQYKRASKTDWDSDIWSRRFHWVIFCGGMTWAAVPQLFLTNEAPIYQIFVTFICGGMIAGAAGSLCYVTSAYLAYALPIVGSLALAFLSQEGGAGISMALLTVFFGASFYLSAKKNQESSLTALRLIEENQQRDQSTRALIEQNEQRFKDYANASSDWFWETDEDHRFTYISPRFHEISGSSSADFIGKTREEINAAKGSANSVRWRELNTILNKHAPFRNFDYQLTTETGQLLWVRISGIPFHKLDGSFGGYRGVGNEISGEKQLQQSLVDAKNRAQESDRTKSAFLANMSHEIRTPLTAINGFAKVLSNTSLNKQQQDAVETIVRNGDHLLQVINEILDLSKIEAGKVELENTPNHLLQMIEDVSTITRLSAQEKQLEFITDYQFPLPEIVLTDATRFKQILLNLSNNAVKFTPQGRVKISVHFVHYSNTLIIDVEDTGIGMTPEQQTTVFEAFSQADASTTRKFGGTGLGLHISKHFAEILNGKISVTSEIGKGSCFRLAFDLTSQGKLTLIDSQPESLTRDLSIDPDDHPESFESHKTQRVLYAEDNEDNQMLTKRYLEKLGVEFRIVCNGKEAVDALASEHFDLILMDIQMPEMDGIEASRTLRERGYTGPIIALTANVMRDDIKTYQDIGMDGVIAKPIDEDLFFHTVTRFLHQRNPTDTTRALPKVLIAEDAIDNRKLLELILDDSKYALEFATNGQEAVEMATNNTFDLILMDIEMPIMNGVDATKKIRAAGITIPIAALTGHSNTNDIPGYEQAGFSAHIEKPIEATILDSKLSAMLNNLPLPSNVVIPPPPTSRLGTERMAMLQAGFLSRLPERRDNLKNAVDAQDWDAQKGICHDLKGSAASFGFPEMTELAKEADANIKNGDRDTALQDVQKLLAYIEAVLLAKANSA